MSKKGLIIMSVFFGICTLIFIGTTAYTASERNEYKAKLENGSRRSYYDLVAEINDMDIKLNKIVLSTSANYQRELLLETWRVADTAQANVASLSTGNDLILKTVKFVNQTGDYCKYLEERISRTGDALSKDEKTAINNLAEINTTLKDELNSFDINSISGLSLFNADGGNGFIDSMNENVDVSIDYPELIYDGPFSDSMLNKEPKLNEREYSPEETIEYVKKVFGISEENKIVYDGIQDGKISTYNMSFDDSNVQISVKGAKLLSFNTDYSVEEQKLSENDCIVRAKEFVLLAGFNNMKDVWISNYNGVMFINLVYETDGIIVYSDMVKVKVASDTGEIIGFDAQEYLINHYDDRTVESPTIIEEEIRAKAPSDMNVQNITLALVPKGKNEILTYEIYGQYNGTDYFVYVDAKTGDEVNILEVIDGDSGRLLV